jgi:hypothetical protein
VLGLMAVDSVEEYKRLIGEDVGPSPFEKLEEKLSHDHQEKPSKE